MRLAAHIETESTFPNRFRRALRGLTLVAVAIPLSAVAQLSWNTRQLDFHPTATDAEVQGDFEFFNSGNAPITILDIKTSCGCTTAALDKKTYGPGEKGKIAAVFKIGERMGLQQKQIMVTTDNPEEASVQLTLRTFIPEIVRMEPRAVIWPLNGENGPRTVHITTGTDQPVKILGVRASDDRFFAQLKQVEPGKAYDITVLASSTTEPLRGVVRIETDYPANHPKVYNLNVEIQAPFVPQAQGGQTFPPKAVAGTASQNPFPRPASQPPPGYSAAPAAPLPPSTRNPN